MALPASKQLYWWEQRWLNKEDIAPTRFAVFPLWQVTLLATLILALLAAIPFSPWWLLLPVLGRLLALDLSLRVLPNVYVLPLFLLGMLTSILTGHLAISLFSLGIALLFLGCYAGLSYLFSRQPPQLGGGDAKLMLAMAVWLTPFSFVWSLLAASLLMLPFLWKQKDRNGLPFGPALILSFVFFLFHTELFIRLISSYLLPIS